MKNADTNDSSQRSSLRPCVTELGKFIYVFGDAYDDSPIPLLYETPLKIGVTTDPKQRLSNLRRITQQGIWYDIRYMRCGADITEKCLIELFNPWRVGFEKEWFILPQKVRKWLMDGMEDNWYRIAKQHALFGEGIYTLTRDIMTWYYPAKWLDDRIERMNATYCEPTLVRQTNAVRT